jgi:hypothetical protein
MVIHQGIHSGECTVPVVCAVQLSLQRGTFCTFHDFFLMFEIFLMWMMMMMMMHGT